MNAEAGAAQGPAASGFESWLLRRRRRVLTLLVTAIVLAFAAIMALKCLANGVRDPTGLERATDATSFIAELTRQNGAWPRADEAPPPGRTEPPSPARTEAPPPDRTDAPRPGRAETPAAGGAASSPGVRVEMLPLRLVLFVDSVLLVPGYAGLLLFGTVFLCVALPGARRAGGIGGDARMTPRELGLHLLCLVPVTAAAFDIAENGMTIRAVEDAVAYVLADETVGDVHRATVLKLLFIGVASGALGAVSWSAARALAGAPDARRVALLLRLSAPCAAVAFVVFVGWRYAPMSGLTVVGVVSFALQLGLVAGAIWRINGFGATPDETARH